MPQYYNTAELCNRTIFDDDFIAFYISLTDSAKAIVAEKNRALNRFLNTITYYSYENYDFNQDRVVLSYLFVHEIKGDNMICPQDNLALRKQNFVVKIGGKTSGFFMHVCDKCKCIYSNEREADEKYFNSMNIPYSFAEEDV